MPHEVYRYTFPVSDPPEEVQASLVLAVFAAESLHGESQARLDANYTFDAGTRTCVIDAGTDVGRDLNRIFVGFLRREFGEDGFEVRRIESTAAAATV